MRQGKRSLIKFAALVGATGICFGLHILLLRLLPVHVFNTGVSFGVAVPGQNLILAGMLLAGSVYWVLRSTQWALGVILVGGWVNYGDRLLYGYVHDYWKLPGIGLYNNIADWVIFAGIMVLVLEIWKEHHGRRTI